MSNLDNINEKITQELNNYLNKEFYLKKFLGGNSYTVIELIPLKHSQVEEWEIGILYTNGKEKFIRNKEYFEKVFTNEK